MSEPLTRKRMRYNLRSSVRLNTKNEAIELPTPILKRKGMNALMKTYFRLIHALQFTENFDVGQCGKHTKLNVAKAFLRTFGYQIVSMKLPHEFLYHNEQTIHVLLSSVQKYCTNLKELTIKLKPKCMFQKLQILALDECFVNRDWCKMKHLQTLTLDEVIFRPWSLVEDEDASDRGSEFESSDYDYDSDNFDSDDSNDSNTSSEDFDDDFFLFSAMTALPLHRSKVS